MTGTIISVVDADASGVDDGQGQLEELPSGLGYFRRMEVSNGQMFSM